MAVWTFVREQVRSIPVLGKAAPRLVEAVNAALSVAHSRLYYRLRRARHRVAWSVSRNPRSRRLFLAHKPVLTPAQERVVQDLRMTGIALVRVEDLGVNAAELERLRRQVDAFSSCAAQLIDRARASGVESLEFGDLAHNRGSFTRFFSDAQHARNDDYVVKMNPETSEFSAHDPLVALGLGSPILDVANSYFGLWSKLKYMDAWHSMPMPSARIGSLRWHRDGEDWQMLKVYLYCADVDDDAGPMEFIPGTNYAATSHPANRPAKAICDWKESHLSAKRYAFDSIERSFPASARLKCTGGAGTLVFCDTAGFHRGGIPRSKPRVLAHWAYVTPSSFWQRRFSIRQAEMTSLGEAARFAVH